MGRGSSLRPASLNGEQHAELSARRLIAKDSARAKSTQDDVLASRTFRMFWKLNEIDRESRKSDRAKVREAALLAPLSRG